jgi:HlyD family secretion protein
MRSSRALAVVVLGLATACGPAATATPLATIVLEPAGTPGAGGGATVAASGRVVPAQEAHLAFPEAGIVESLEVAVGDVVRAGEVLIELDGTAAELALGEAERAVREMTSMAAIAAADQAVAEARQAQDTAQKKVNALSYPRATEAFIDNLRGQITLAREELADATRSFNRVEDLADNDPKKAGPMVRMTQAQINLNKLLGQYNWYTGSPSEIDVALTYANLDAATAAVHEAEWYAAALRGEPLPADASGANLSALESARDALTRARSSLESTRLTSPFAGTVVSIEIFPGEYATPGQVVAVVSDVGHLRVETTDLSERDVAAVDVGQSVTVFIEALGLDLPGEVLTVSPVADLLGGDVVYETTIDLEGEPPDLRPGMSAEVRFNVGP